MAGGRIKGITIEIGGETTKLEKALKSVYDKGRDLTREMKDVNRALKFNPKNVELTAQKQSILKEQVENTRKRLDELKSSQEQVNEQYRKGEIGEEQYRAFQREIIETESILKSYEKQLSEVADKHKLIGSSMQEFGGKMQTVGGKMQDVGKSLSLKVTAPLVAMGGFALKTGMEFESAMSEVQAVSGATGKELESLEASAREVGKTTNKSASEAADALKYLGMAGWDVEDSQAALLPLVKLSTAGNIELGRAADLVTNSMSTMGIEVADVDRYLDVLAKTSTMTNTDIDGLGEAFITVGGRLQGLGVDFEEGAAALAVLAKNGIEGSEAGTSLNAVLANLTAPTGRAKQALEELGVSAFDSNGEFIGIEETLQLVEDAMVGMDGEQRNMYQSMIGGKEHMTALSHLMNGLEGDFDNFKEGVQSSDGSLNKMYDTMTDNMAGAIDGLKSSVSEVSIQFSQMSEGPLKGLIDKLTQAVDWFGNLDSGTQQTIFMAGGFVAALGPVITILGTTTKNMGYLIEGGGKLIGNWDKVKGAGSLLAGGLKGTVGFLFSPAGAILIGIAAVLAGGVLLYKNWDKVKEKASQLKESVSESWNNLKESTSETWENVKESVSGKMQDMKLSTAENLYDISESFGQKLSESKSIVSQKMGEIVLNFTGRFGEAYGETESVLGSIKSAFKGTMGDVKIETATKMYDVSESIGNRLSESKSKTAQNLGAIVNNFTSSFGQAYGETESIFGSIKTAMGDSMTTAKNLVGGKINELKNNMTSKATEIKNNTVNKFTELKNGTVGRISETVGSVRSKFSEVYNGIMSPINRARDGVRSAINTMKGFFNFNWKLPSIKMPRFSVSGSANPLNWLKEGVPKLSVSWHAKGGILTRPGVFGMMGNQLLAGGEHRTGGEAILPLNRLSGLMADAMEMVRETSPHSPQVIKVTEKPEIHVHQEINSPKALDAREAARLSKISMRNLAYLIGG